MLGQFSYDTTTGMATHQWLPVEPWIVMNDLEDATGGWGFHPMPLRIPWHQPKDAPSWGQKNAPTLAPPPTPETHSTITPGTHYRWTMTCQNSPCTTQVDKKELFDDSKPTSWTRHGAIYDDTHFIRPHEPGWWPYRQDLLTIPVGHPPLETLSTNTI
jgi:hypothetical protein